MSAECESQSDRPDQRWEYRELTISLNLSTRDFLDHRGLVRRFDQLVQRQLQRAAADGWEADGATEWDALQAAGRIRRRQTSAFFPRWTHQTVYVYEFVSVRLKRPAASP